MKLLNEDNVERSSNKRTCRDYNHHPKSAMIWIRHSPDYNKHCLSDLVLVIESSKVKSPALGRSGSSPEGGKNPSIGNGKANL